MKVISKEEILRLNCPGFGEQSFLNNGRAKALDAYTVIVANPLSVLHLFDIDSDTLKHVESAQIESLTSIDLNSDQLLKTINDEITDRTEQLVNFLDNGGLLAHLWYRSFV